MNATQTEAQGQEQLPKPKDAIIKLVYILRRFTDEWAERQLCYGGHNFNNAHLPMLMSIGNNGISNNALATRLNITKQAASKVIKTLEADGLVKSEKSPADARSVMLYLTSDGQKLYTRLYTQLLHLEEEYQKLVGTRNYEIAMEVMKKLINFHEEQLPGCRK